MNIGTFTECYDPQINGVIISIKNLEKELRSNGHNMYIFAPKRNGFKDTVTNIYRQPSIKYIFQPEFNFASFNHYMALQKAKEWKLDLIHSHTEFNMGLVSAAIAERMNIPLIYSVHTFWEYYNHYILWGLIPLDFFRKSLTRLYNKSNYIIVPSSKMKDYLVNVLQVNAGVKIIPIGLKLDNFYNYKINPEKRKELRARYGIHEHDPVMIFVGRIGIEKSIDVLLKGIPVISKIYPDIKIIIVGGGPALKNITMLVKKLAIEKHVIFTGYIAWENINQFYKMSDVFVSASTTETQGLVLVEAMASCLPVVVRNDKAYLNLVTDGYNGFVFDKDEEFPDCVINILDKKKVYPELCQNALSMSKNYTIAEYGKKVERFYQFVMEDYYRTIKK